MMSGMKRRNPAVNLVMVFVFSFCISVASFAEEEKSENAAVAGISSEVVLTEGTPEEIFDASETADGDSAEQEAETAVSLTPVAENETGYAEENTAEDEAEEPEEEDLVAELVKVREELTEFENNEDFDIKSAYEEYKALETDEEKTEYVAALAEEESGLFTEYLTVKEKEQSLLAKVAELAVTDPEAAQVIELEVDRKFAEDELNVALAELEAIETALNTEQQEAAEQKNEDQITKAESEVKEITENADPLIEAENSEATEERDQPENTDEAVTEEAAAEVIDGLNSDESAKTAQEENTEDPEAAEKISTEENVASEGVENSESAENVEGSENTEETESEENLPGESAAETETVPEKKIDLWYEYDGELEYGKEILINSNITGYGDNISLQWYYSTDGINYEPIEGAVAPTYLFMLDETNCWYYWNLIATEQ